MKDPNIKAIVYMITISGTTYSVTSSSMKEAKQEAAERHVLYKKLKSHPNEFIKLAHARIKRRIYK